MKNTTFISLFIMLSLICPATALAQNGRILYHDGPVMCRTSTVYVIWSGDWIGNTAQLILSGADAMSNWMMHEINGVISNPTFRGCCERNDPETSDKCRGTFLSKSERGSTSSVAII